ncbi:MAG TPA: DUF6702 family protein [Gemmatimonadaceae bacterium]|jgi:hypothetical protein|nr:DUF6702 family protein [Gemmatimonadaceae bacterium]
MRAGRIMALATVLLVGAGARRQLDAHPLHSTITELVEDRAHGVVRATIRVFADDFGTAVARAAKGRVSPAAGQAWDAAVLSYATTVFGMQDAQGRAVGVHSCGVRRTGDLLWLCLEAATTQPLASLRVRNAILCDLFEDQVNVVQATVAAERRSLLFVRGDSFKPVR